MLKLYRFYWDVGRMGDVEGIFVANANEVARAIDENVYFGEILGKHSEVYGQLEAKDLTVLSDDQDFIEKFMQIMPNGTGYNPLDYIEYFCDECGEQLGRDYPESVILPCSNCAEDS